MTIAEELAKVADEVIQEKEVEKLRRVEAAYATAVTNFASEVPKIIKRGLRKAKRAAARGERKVSIYKVWESHTASGFLRSGEGKKAFGDVSSAMTSLVQGFEKEGFRVTSTSVGTEPDQLADSHSHFEIWIHW